MLSNVTVEGKNGLQTILLGQPQFRRKLASPDLDQLRQRVLASYHLGPLSDEETRAYIEYRLGAVGWHDDPNWTDGAYAAIYRYTGGIPRRINRLCSRVLLYGALEESHTITAPMVDSTADELQHDLEGAPMGAAAGLAPAGVGAGGDDLATQIGHAITAPLGYADDRSYTELVHRVQVLEETVARRERVFQRLMDVFSGFNQGRK